MSCRAEHTAGSDLKVQDGNRQPPPTRTEQCSQYSVQPLRGPVSRTRRLSLASLYLGPWCPRMLPATASPATTRTTSTKTAEPTTTTESATTASKASTASPKNLGKQEPEKQTAQRSY